VFFHRVKTTHFGCRNDSPSKIVIKDGVEDADLLRTAPDPDNAELVSGS
jgi:hypothetical protein